MTNAFYLLRTQHRRPIVPGKIKPFSTASCRVKRSVAGLSRVIGAAILYFMVLFLPAHAEKNDGMLYPGIIQSQHACAVLAMHDFFACHWQDAESLCCVMKKIERDSGAVPLSYLLRFAMRTWRILNDECENKAQSEAMLKELDPLRAECLRILHTQHFSQVSRPTRLFLEGGINGFNATLKIRTQPVTAMISGLSSVKLLDTAHALAPSMADVYLGLGIAQCALANEPGIIQLAMHLFSGLHVNLDTGLAYLRICSKEAMYTKEGAQEYLIQFLSPQIPSQSDEKQEIFKTLQSNFPGNPYYVFQELDEGFSFHRQMVYQKRLVESAVPQMSRFDTSNFILKTYANLVKMQCAAIDTVLTGEHIPQCGSIHPSFSFYPMFLETAAQKYELDMKKRTMLTGLRKMEVRRYLHEREQTIHILCSSGINPMLREYYLWHIEDGLPK